MKFILLLSSGRHKDPDNHQTRLPKSECFNQICSKPRKIQRVAFLSICIPDYIFPDRPEIPILPGSDFKIAYWNISCLTFICLAEIPQKGISRKLPFFRSLKYLQFEMESFVGHQHPSDLVP